MFYQSIKRFYEAKIVHFICPLIIEILAL